MAKNIQWKKSIIDYDELNKVSPKSLGIIKGGKSGASGISQRDKGTLSNW